jgi:hypothetical protein
MVVITYPNLIGILLIALMVGLLIGLWIGTMLLLNQPKLAKMEVPRWYGQARISGPPVTQSQGAWSTGVVVDGKRIERWRHNMNTAATERWINRSGC